MTEREQCERCEGTGADPRQSFFIDEVGACVDCAGEGFFVLETFVDFELRLTA